MSKITKIRLIQARAKGFRGFKNEVVFDFDEGKTIFVGENGKGKSSIGELIAWVFTGRNFEGRQKELNLTNKRSTMTYGSVVFEDQNGIHVVERKLARNVTIKFDGQEISQKKLEEIIPSELFLTIFNPLYFVSLSPADARNAIISLLPKLTKEMVLDNMDPYEREKLEKEKFEIEFTNEYLKNRREELKEVENNKKWLEGYIDKLKEPIAIPEEKHFDEEQMAKIQKQIEELNAQKPDLKNLDDLLKKRNEIQEKILEIQNRKFDVDPQTLLEQKRLLEQKLAMEREKTYVPAIFSEKENELNILRNEYKHIKNNILKLDEQIKALKEKRVEVKEGDCCPYCKQTLSRRIIDLLQKELEAELQGEIRQLEEEREIYWKQLMDLEAKGKQLALQIQQEKAEDERKRREFEANKESAIRSLFAQIQQIEADLKTVGQKQKEFEEQKQREIEALKAEIEKLGIDQLESENARIQKEFDERVSKEMARLKQELARLQAERDAVIRHESNRKALIEQEKKRIEELKIREKEMENLLKLENEIKEKIFLMKAFNAKQTELLNKEIKKFLKDVEIRLQKVVESTGELKDCFEILYQDKELRICSSSERVRAGLEISRMVCALAGVEYPVFVDNGESITSYDSSGLTQIIETRVVKDKPLSKISA